MIFSVGVALHMVYFQHPDVPYGRTWWDEPAPIIAPDKAREFLMTTMPDGNLVSVYDDLCDCGGEHDYVLIIISHLLEPGSKDSVTGVVRIRIMGCEHPGFHDHVMTRDDLYQLYKNMERGSLHDYNSSENFSVLCPLLDEISPQSGVPL